MAARVRGAGLSARRAPAIRQMRARMYPFAAVQHAACRRTIEPASNPQTLHQKVRHAPTHLARTLRLRAARSTAHAVPLCGVRRAPARGRHRTDGAAVHARGRCRRGAGRPPLEQALRRRERPVRRKRHGGRLGQRLPHGRILRVGRLRGRAAHERRAS